MAATPALQKVSEVLCKEENKEYLTKLGSGGTWWI